LTKIRENPVENRLLEFVTSGQNIGDGDKALLFSHAQGCFLMHPFGLGIRQGIERSGLCSDFLSQIVRFGEQPILPSLVLSLIRNVCAYPGVFSLAFTIAMSLI